jgi:hypothetical protein
MSRENYIMGGFLKKTQRGFGLIEFKDQNGEDCSLQESSSGMERRIWLGCDNIGLKQLIPGRGWINVELDEKNCLANTRMHLNQKQVAELLPALQYFVEHGELGQ